MKHSASMLTILAVVGFVCSPAFADLTNLDIGGQIQIDAVYADNTWDFNNDGWYGGGGYGDDQDAFVRTEAHLWFHAELAENVTARISIESDRAWSSEDAHLWDFGSIEDGYPYPKAAANGRYYFYSNYGHPYGLDDMDDLDIFLEEAYIKIADFYGLPATIVVGRQFMELGDGFVIGDSNPASPGNIASLGRNEQDPFDAIKIDYEMTMDWLLSLAWAKLIETRSIQEDTDLFIVNVGYYGLEDHVVEVYYVFTLIDAEPRADIHQAGIRGEGLLFEGWTYHAELTYQFADDIKFSQISGMLSDQDIGGWAGEAGIRWAPPSLEANEVAFGFVLTYLSGDDNPTDSDYDGYIQVADNRVYGEIADYYDGLVVNHTYTNRAFAGVLIFNVDAEAAFTDRTKGALEAYYFLSDEDVTRGGESDDTIGWEIDAYLDHEITEDLSAQLAAGFFDPDDAAQLWLANNFQGHLGDDLAWFLRASVTVSF